MLAVEKNANNNNPLNARFWFGGVETRFEPDGNWAIDKSIARANLGQPVVRIERSGLTGPREIKQIYHSTLDHVIATLDDQNQIGAGFIHGPFGEVLDSTGTEASEHSRRFNGKDFDKVSQLSYYGARYYDSRSLTWRQGDPLYQFARHIAFDQPRLMNLYTFSLNNPMVYVDPDGRNPVAITAHCAKNMHACGAAAIAVAAFFQKVIELRGDEVVDDLKSAVRWTLPNLISRGHFRRLQRIKRTRNQAWLRLINEADQSITNVLSQAQDPPDSDEAAKPDDTDQAELTDEEKERQPGDRMSESASRDAAENQLA